MERILVLVSPVKGLQVSQVDGTRFLWTIVYGEIDGSLLSITGGLSLKFKIE